VLLPRIASAIVLAPLALALVWKGGPLLVLAAALAAGWCAFEYFRLLEKAGLRPAWPLGVAGAACLAASPAVPGTHLGALALALIALGPGLYFVAEGAPFARAAQDWAQTAFGALVIGWPLGQGVALRAAEGDQVLFGVVVARGALLLAAAMTLTWASDISAYAVGRLFGRRAFFPAISPHKTREGAIAAVAAPAVIGVVWGGPLGWPVPFALVVGAAAGVAAIAGDLLESMLKRAVAAKDSGTLIPGHGGLLDRLDSLLLVLVAVALLTGQAWP
jgi:phosphatidate cytidylyltransferase